MNNIGLFRDIQTSELEMMLAWRNEPNVRQNMYTQQEIPIEEHARWWEGIKNTNHQYMMYEFNSSPMGIVYFTSIDRVNSNCAWGFYASPQAPRGTGTKMEFLALQYVFETLGLHKLYCEVISYNQPVIKLHGKFGFSQEGVFREQFLKDESFVDIVRLGITKKEWSDKRDELEKKIISFMK